LHAAVLYLPKAKSLQIASKLQKRFFFTACSGHLAGQGQGERERPPTVRKYSAHCLLAAGEREREREERETERS